MAEAAADDEALAAARRSPRTAFARGFIEMVPASPALVAWALVTGVAMAKSSLTLAEAVGLSVLGYAGAAQLAALPLMMAGAPVVVSVLAALMVNLRFMIYSAALAPSFRTMPLRTRIGLGYLIGDMNFVMYMNREADWRDSPLRGWYFAGLGLAIFVFWHAGAFAGLFGAAAVPTEWGLDFVGTVALLALLVPMLFSRPSLAGSVVAAVLSVLLRGLPFRTGLVLAILAGIVVAVVVEDARERRR